MGAFDRLRRWLGRADEATAGVERAAVEGLHKAEDAVDHATGGRLYGEHEPEHQHEPGNEHEAPSEEPRQQG